MYLDDFETKQILDGLLTLRKKFNQNPALLEPETYSALVEAYEAFVQFANRVSNSKKTSNLPSEPSELKHSVLLFRLNEVLEIKNKIKYEERWDEARKLINEIVGKYGSAEFNNQVNFFGFDVLREPMIKLVNITRKEKESVSKVMSEEATLKSLNTLKSNLKEEKETAKELIPLLISLLELGNKEEVVHTRYLSEADRIAVLRPYLIEILERRLVKY